MLKAVVNSPVRSGDQTINNGNLIVGTAGKGIDFSANTHAAGMTSELLAWYEEGTWTPTITAVTGTFTTVSGAVGAYTRIGRQVTITWSFTVTDKGTGGGGYYVAGLPFNYDTSGSKKYAGSGYNYSTTEGRTTYTGANGSIFEVYKITGGDPVTAGQQEVGQLTYFA